MWNTELASTCTYNRKVPQNDESLELTKVYSWVGISQLLYFLI